MFMTSLGWITGSSFPSVLFVTEMAWYLPCITIHKVLNTLGSYIIFSVNVLFKIGIGPISSGSVILENFPFIDNIVLFQFSLRYELKQLLITEYREMEQSCTVICECVGIVIICNVVV